ncbi:hypothetical protein PVAP13_5NG223800 [Panicum virgatum]|uniref:Uncharacterized protein n=1 Tax=Panicum virgatum TaxID=38727 RepID=A0A8T0RQ52_PANVG|nr:hypothetical protein PVAP13_5NG223800 [Panicum virgatum]
MECRHRRAAEGAPTRGVLGPQLERLHPLQRSGLRPPRLRRRRRPLQHRLRRCDIRRRVLVRVRLQFCHRCLDRHGARASIIRYQLDGSRLSFIKLPRYDQFEDTLVLVPAAGRLQFAALRASKEWKVRLRELVIDSDGAPKWIRREKFVLPMPCVRMAGFVEEPPSLILDTKDKETICINMEDCKWHKLPKANGEFDLLPIMSFYPPLSPGTAHWIEYGSLCLASLRHESSPSQDEEEAFGSSASRIRIFSNSVLPTDK